MALQPFSVAVGVGSNDPLVEATNYKVGAEVYVKLTSTGNPLATVYLDEAGANPITQPLVSNSRGMVEFFANAGQYILEYNDGQQLLSTRIGVGATEHSALTNLNAVGGHDTIYRRAATVAQIGNGDFAVGSRLTVTDRGDAPFDIVAGGTPNTYDKIDAGGGNVAQLQWRDGMSVEAFGATGTAKFNDGTGAYFADAGLTIPATDDTAALNYASTYVSALGGGNLTALATGYLVDMISFGFFIKSNVIVTGAGIDSTRFIGNKIAASSNFVYVISLAGASNNGLKHCTVDANRPSDPFGDKQWHAVRWDGDSDNTTVESVKCINTQGDGLWIVKNPGFSSVPTNGKIVNCEFDNIGRQDIALVEGDGFTLDNNRGTGTLDLESDSPNGRVNQNHTVINNSFDVIRISPLTGLAGASTNIIANDNRCRVLSTWGGNNDVLTNNIVSENIEISQCGKLTINGGSCDRVTQNVTNSTSVDKLIINKLNVSSDTALVGLALKDVVDAEISINIKLTAAGSKGIVHANNSTQTVGNIDISASNIDTESHCIDISALGLTNTTHRISGKNRLKSATGRSVSKSGAGSSGKIEMFDNDIYSQPVLRNSANVKIGGNRYYGVSAINVDQNTADNITITNERYYGVAPTLTLGSQTLTGSMVVDDVMGVDVTIGAAKISFSGLTAVDIFMNEIVSNSAAPFTAISSRIRIGSNTNITGDATKYGQWYNGTSWVNKA